LAIDNTRTIPLLQVL